MNLNPTLIPMIPEIENKNSIVAFFRRNLHQAFRRRTWRFKRNDRLTELLPQKPQNRMHAMVRCMVPALAAAILFRS